MAPRKIESDPVVGLWGTPTTTWDWCEANYEVRTGMKHVVESQNHIIFLRVNPKRVRVDRRNFFNRSKGYLCLIQI